MNFIFKTFYNIILLYYSQQKAVSILVENVEKLQVKQVVEKLSQNKLYLHYVRWFAAFNIH